jgi:hypothetical protein
LQNGQRTAVVKSVILRAYPVWRWPDAVPSIEAPRFHHASWRCDGSMAARGTRAAGRQSPRNRISVPGPLNYYDEFRRELRELGYVEGQTSSSITDFPTGSLIDSRSLRRRRRANAPAHVRSYTGQLSGVRVRSSPSGEHMRRHEVISLLLRAHWAQDTNVRKEKS